VFKFEIHLHTSACSGCGRSTAKAMTEAAIEHDYSGIVITNHFYHGNTCINRELPWKEFVAPYAEDYYNAREYGEKKGITVFFGIEEVYEPGKEMLIYGLNPESIADCTEFRDMNPKQMSNFVHQNGGLTVCAHPFRNRAYIPNPDSPPDASIFDGAECYNHFNPPEENLKAFVFAKNTGLFMTSGCDIHHHGDFGNAGIEFFEEIKSYEQFLTLLKKGEYKLITPYKI